MFNDRRFKENPNDMVYANNAISCYLQAAGLYKNGKTRKLLARILWLISLDDASGTLAQAFENFRGEVPVWYWITFIPQLLTSLSQKEAKLAKQILIRIAKNYPQALHFQLRTAREEFAAQQRHVVDLARQQAAQVSAATATVPSSSSSPNGVNDTNSTNQQSKLNGSLAGNGEKTQQSPTSQPQQPPHPQINIPNSVRQPLEHIDEIMAILKTAYPLMALSLESLVDQINQRFKCTADEDAYRLCVALLNDGIQYLNKIGNPKEDAKLPPITEANITRFAETVLPKQIRAEFEKIW